MRLNEDGKTVAAMDVLCPGAQGSESGSGWVQEGPVHVAARPMTNLQAPELPPRPERGPNSSDRPLDPTRFDATRRGIGELVGGSQREERMEVRSCRRCIDS